jgi:hypothetical protein
MGKPTENAEEQNILKKELNQYWYCPKDGNKLQVYHNKRVQSPHFNIDRAYVEVGINNAVASKRIPPEAIERTWGLVELIFQGNPALDVVDLISVYCSSCGTRYAAPKLDRVESSAKSQARALYESHQALQTKNFGPFRFIDHYGVGQYLQRERNQGAGSRRWLFYILFIGIRTIAMILILYYIMGLEVRLGKKWFPLGIVMLVLSVIGFIFIIVNSPAGDFLQDLLGGY